jgi:hypothetical protein
MRAAWPLMAMALAACGPPAQPAAVRWAYQALVSGEEACLTGDLDARRLIGHRSGPQTYAAFRRAEVGCRSLAQRMRSEPIPRSASPAQHAALHRTRAACAHEVLTRADKLRYQALVAKGDESPGVIRGVLTAATDADLAQSHCIAARDAAARTVGMDRASLEAEESVAWRR